MNCIVHVPASLKALPHRVVRDPREPRPVCQRHALASSLKEPVRSSIVRLDSSVCPPAILRRVAFRVVDSVQGAADRLWPHVGQEITEPVRATPPLAYSDPARAVVMVRMVVRLMATANHRVPCFVLKRATGQSRAVNLLWPSHEQASARLYRPASQMGQARHLAGSACTLASHAVLFPCVSDDREFAKRGAKNMSVVHACYYQATRMGAQEKGWARRIADNLMGA